MTKRESFLVMAVGVLFLIGGIGMFLHDYDYIVHNTTINLNDTISYNDTMPRGKYVTYTCDVSLGEYAYTRNYIDGIIPLPGKTHRYAMLTENLYVISADLENEDIMEKMDIMAMSDYDSSNEVTITGLLTSNDAEMNGYLADYCSECGFDGSDVTPTLWCIDTTKTRAGTASLDLMACVTGAGVTALMLRKIIVK